MSKQVEITGGEWGAIVRHVAPFLVWVLIMSLPMADQALRYAIQTGATVAVLAWLRPWRYYTPVSWRDQPMALLVGFGVFVIWVVPELPCHESLRGAQELYLRFGIRGAAATGSAATPYAPEQCGWGLSVVRLAGSAFVIAMAEEFFWRGFLLRWLKGRPFLSIAPETIGPGLLLTGSVLFGIEHTRWLAGVIAGLAYGYLYLRTRDLSAAITAHVTTNFLLGLYVLVYHDYRFW